MFADAAMAVMPIRLDPAPAAVNPPAAVAPLNPGREGPNLKEESWPTRVIDTTPPPPADPAPPVKLAQAPSKSYPDNLERMPGDDVRTHPCCVCGKLACPCGCAAGLPCTCAAPKAGPPKTIPQTGYVPSSLASHRAFVNGRWEDVRGVLLPNGNVAFHWEDNPHLVRAAQPAPVQYQPAQSGYYQASSPCGPGGCGVSRPGLFGFFRRR